MLKPIKYVADEPNSFTSLARNARQAHRYAYAARDWMFQWSFVVAVLAIAIFWAWMTFR